MIKNDITDLIKKSFELKSQGYLKPAIEMLYKALEVDGENFEILSQLGELYFELGNYERSKQYIDKVLEQNKNHEHSLKILGKIFLQKKEIASAKEVFERAFEISHTPEILLERIKILNEIDEYDEIKELEKLKENSEDTYCEIAKAHAKHGEFKKALTLLEKISDKNQEAQVISGKIYYELKDFNNALKMFKSAQKHSPTAEINNYLGLLELNAADYSCAVKYFSKALKEEPQNAQYNFNLAEAYFLNGWWEEAQKSFSTAIILAPDNEDYRFALAWGAYKYGMFERAKTELRTVKNHSGARVLNALLKMQKDDFIGAKKDLEDISAKNPSDEFALRALAKVYTGLCRHDDAYDTVKKALELNPKSFETLCEIIQIALAKKDFEAVDKYLKSLLALNKNYFPAHILKAEAAYQAKDFKALWDTAQKLIKLDENSWEGYYYNALALFEQGDTDFAIESLKKAISLNVNNAMLYVKMSELYQQLGQNDNAFLYINEAAEIDKSAKNRELYRQLANVVRKK